MSRNWLEGAVRNSLGTFSLHEHDIIVYETTEISEPQSALIFNARVRRPKGEAKGETESSGPLTRVTAAGTRTRFGLSPPRCLRPRFHF
jgi:hypothetical protein